MDRGHSQYGKPTADFTRIAGMLNALFARKLLEPFTPDEIAMVQICVKLSRQHHRAKRDNTVDIAGYALTMQECLDEALTSR